MTEKKSLTELIRLGRIFYKYEPIVLSHLVIIETLIRGLESTGCGCSAAGKCSRCWSLKEAEDIARRMIS